MEIKQEAIFDNIRPDGCCSLKIQKYIITGGERFDKDQPWRRAVCPGDFEVVERYAPELMQAAMALWTAEVIERWEERA
jgi:hypothetical protein